MDRNPEQLYDLDSGVPVPEELVLLYHFDGFVDAGSAGEVVTDHLLSEFDGSSMAAPRPNSAPTITDTS